MAHSVHIALAEKLCAVNAGTAQAAEDSQHVHHQDRIGDGGCGNRFCPQAADHDIVQQGNEGRNKLLDHHGDQQGHDILVESPCSDKPLQHTKETSIP